MLQDTIKAEVLKMRTCGCDEEPGWTTQCRQCSQLIEHLDKIVSLSAQATLTAVKDELGKENTYVESSYEQGREDFRAEVLDMISKLYE